jgi:hypothetical protein
MKPSNQFVRNGVHRWTALLFVLVIAVFGVVQAAHTHDGISKDGVPNTPTHCASCVASHSVAVTAEVSFRPVLALQPGTILCAEPQLESRQLLFTSFTRPPPPAL